MANKLGFYIEVSTRQWITEALQEVQPPTILWHAGDRGKLQEIRRGLAPEAFIIGRIYLENQEQDAMLDSPDPAAKGREFANRILNYDLGYATEEINGRRLVNAWMSLNEAVPGPASSDFKSKPEQVKRRLRAYDLFQEAFRQQLQTRQVEAVAFNFAAGNFTEASHYLEWFPRTLASHQYLGFHEYGWPSLRPGPDVATAALLYRRCMEGIRQKYPAQQHEVIITECGLARMYKYPVDPPGDVGWLYTGDAVTQEDYWQALLWYNAELCKDSYVKGACLYQVGHGGGRWETFRHLGEDNQGQSLQIIRRIGELRRAAPTPPGPTPPTPPTPPVPFDLAGLQQRAAALEGKVNEALQQLRGAGTWAGRKQKLETAAQQVKQAAAALAQLAALQERIGRAQAQARQRSGIPAALLQRLEGLAQEATALRARLQALADLASPVAQAQKDVQKALEAQGNLAAQQKQGEELLAAVRRLRADLGAGMEISLRNPAPGVRVSQGFGQNPAMYKPYNLVGHEGIDYACDVGTPALAAASGVVYKAGDSQGAYGIRVILEHRWGGQKGYTIYAHLSSVGVNVGDTVTAGDVVGKSGNSGTHTTGPHLHLSLVLLGKPNEGYKSVMAGDAWFHNPAPYFEGTRGLSEWPEEGELAEDPDALCVPPQREDEV